MRERRSREEVEQVLEATAEQLAGAWGMCVRGLEGGWGLFGGGGHCRSRRWVAGVGSHTAYPNVCIHIYSARGLPGKSSGE